jgi:hypothetical protein
VRRKSHAPFWSSGRRSDPPIDCNRLTLDIRQRVAAVGRRVNTLCQGEDGLRQQLAVYHVYYNFCLPQASLRVLSQVFSGGNLRYALESREILGVISKLR